jgi:hypothetical protein
MFNFGSSNPAKHLREELAGFEQNVVEKTKYKFHDSMELSSPDFGLHTPASVVSCFWFCEAKACLGEAMTCFKSLSSKIADAAAAANFTLQDCLLSSKDAASCRPTAATPDGLQNHSDSDPEQSQKKRKVDLTEAVAKAKALKLLPFSFQAPAEIPKSVLKISHSSPKPNFVVACYVLQEKAKNLKAGAIAAASLSHFPRAPGDIAVNEVPYRALQDGRMLLCFGGSKPKLRVSLLEETALMKFWPYEVFNLSMLSMKSRAQAISDCPLMPLAYALLLSALVALQE